jgi:hypothetical protein
MQLTVVQFQERRHHAPAAFERSKPSDRAVFSGPTRGSRRESRKTIGIDPTDGTRRYRDRTGGAWSGMLHLRSKSAALHSLVRDETG